MDAIGNGDDNDNERCDYRDTIKTKAGVGEKSERAEACGERVREDACAETNGAEAETDN